MKFWWIAENSTPNKQRIDFVNSLKDEGHHITIWTGRGGISGSNWRKLTEEQLKEWNVMYDDLLIGKPCYDCYIDDCSKLNVGKFYNHELAVLVPNLTYNPRACFLPRKTITDGSVAILTLKNPSNSVSEKDIEYYGTSEFKNFYAIARNYGTRSLNIDNNSVFFFGILKDN